MSAIIEAGPAISFPVPEGACDCHFHIYGPQSRYAYAADRSYTPQDALPDAYFDLIEALGISRGVLVQPSVYGTDNSLLLNLLRDNPACLRGVAAVEATIGDRDLEMMDRAGVKGVRINPRLDSPVSLADLPRFAERISGLGWHVQIIMNVANLSRIVPVVERLAVPVVFDHMGYDRDGAAEWLSGRPAPGYDALFGLLRNRDCWVKLSGAYYLSSAGAPYDDVAELMGRLVEAAPGRAVWGTDWPHPNLESPLPDDRVLLELLARALPDEETRNAVLVDNPEKLYCF